MKLFMNGSSKVFCCTDKFVPCLEGQRQLRCWLTAAMSTTWAGKCLE